MIGQLSLQAGLEHPGHQCRQQPAITGQTRCPWIGLLNQAASDDFERDDFWSYAVLEGDVELSPVATRPDDPVDEMIEHYRAVVGEPDDLDAFRKGQIAQRRVVVRFTPTRAYGLLDVPPPSGS